MHHHQPSPIQHHQPSPMRHYHTVLTCRYVGVLRTYGHRHGAGPFVTELPPPHPINTVCPELHNQTSKWQGPFRVGILDMVAINYSMDIANAGKHFHKQTHVGHQSDNDCGVDWLSITHLDRLHALGDNLKTCVAYEYVGKEDKGVLEKFFEFEIFEEKRVCIKKIKLPKPEAQETVTVDTKLAELLQHCVPLHYEPLYKECPQETLKDITPQSTVSLEQLPSLSIDFIKYIEKCTGVKVGIASFGNTFAHKVALMPKD